MKLGKTEQNYPKASNALIFGGILTYIAGLCLLMAFASPYWIKSYEESFSSFKHMGLWEYCFEAFRYPYYQYDKKFDGCYYIFGQEYFIVREWLLPGWLMVVQAFVTLSLIFSYFSQIIIAMEICRWPLNFVLKREYLLSGIAFICNATTAVLMFLAICIFGGECYRRDWLMYPRYNFLSWSYGFAVITFLIHGFAALFLYLDARKNYEIREQKHALVAQMHPEHSRNGFV